jgi:DHA2 family multidrug resistance protein
MSTAAISAEKEWVPSVNPWLIALSVMLATFMVVLDSSIANVALPHMAGSFSATSHEAMWILTSYLIANGIILPTTAWFSNIFGRKKFLIICIIVFTSASALCGAATSIEMMIVARVIQGLGGGALMPISQSILWECFPKEKRGISMAVFGIGVVLAPVVGPTLGGWITDNYSWNWIFYINVPIGILAVMLSKAFVEDPPYAKKGKIQKIDYIGFCALILWLVTLQVVLDNGQQADWFSSAWVCRTAFVSVMAMIFFFCWEVHFKDSIIDLSVFKNRNFAIGTILATFVNAILYSSLAILPMFLQTLLGYSAYAGGLATTPRGIGCIVTIVLAGFLSGKIDERYQIIFGLVLLAVSSFMFGSLNMNIAMSNIVFPNVICGFALGFCFIPLATASFGTLKNEQMTNATGLQNLMKNIGGAVGISIVSTLLSRYSQIHQASMVSHLNPTNPVFQEKVGMVKAFLSMSMNSDVAAQKTNFLMYVNLVKQSALWAYIDSFRLYGIIALVLIPMVFLLKKTKSHSSSDGAASLH